MVIHSRLPPSEGFLSLLLDGGARLRKGHPLVLSILAVRILPPSTSSAHRKKRVICQSWCSSYEQQQQKKKQKKRDQKCHFRKEVETEKASFPHGTPLTAVIHEKTPCEAAETHSWLVERKKGVVMRYTKCRTSGRRRKDRKRGVMKVFLAVLFLSFVFLFSTLFSLL